MVAECSLVPFAIVVSLLSLAGLGAGQALSGKSSSASVGLKSRCRAGSWSLPGFIFAQGTQSSMEVQEPRTFTVDTIPFCFHVSCPQILPYHRIRSYSLQEGWFCLGVFFSRDKVVKLFCFSARS